MNKLNSILFFMGGMAATFIICDYSNHHDEMAETIGSIEKVENVDEMNYTPKELYFYTEKGKYFFDGKSIEFITDFTNL